MRQKSEPTVPDPKIYTDEDYQVYFFNDHYYVISKSIEEAIELFKAYIKDKNEGSSYKMKISQIDVLTTNAITRNTNKPNGNFIDC